MPNFTLSKARVLLSLIVAGFLSLMCAGPGTLILVSTAPSSVPLLGRIICPAGTNMEARWVRYSYSKPGESNFEIVCVGGSGKTPNESRPRWFLKLSGFYFVAFFLPLLYIFLRARTDTAPPTNSMHLTPEAELEVKRLLVQGKKLKAIKQVQELTGAKLGEAVHYVESLPTATMIDQPTENPKQPAERLRKLRDMVDGGLITEQEYKAKKAEILSEM